MIAGDATESLGLRGDHRAARRHARRLHRRRPAQQPGRRRAIRVATAIGANTGSICYGLLTAFGVAVALQRWPMVWVVAARGGHGLPGVARDPIAAAGVDVSGSRTRAARDGAAPAVWRAACAKGSSRTS